MVRVCVMWKPRTNRGHANFDDWPIDIFGNFKRDGPDHGMFNILLRKETVGKPSRLSLLKQYFEIKQINPFLNRGLQLFN